MPYYKITFLYSSQLAFGEASSCQVNRSGTGINGQVSARVLAVDD